MHHKMYVCIFLSNKYETHYYKTPILCITELSTREQPAAWVSYPHIDFGIVSDDNIQNYYALQELITPHGEMYVCDKTRLKPTISSIT